MTERPFLSPRVRTQRMFLALLIGAALMTLMTWPAFTLTVFACRGQEKEPRPHPAQSAFTYQGQLRDGNEPANGVYDFQFTLYTVQTGGDGLGSIVSEGLVLTNGSFKAQLDFGRAAFDAPESWLEIAVRHSGSAEAYTVLSPRQKLAPTPYAIFAQQERWSLIGIPVGFTSNADTAIVTGKTAGDGVTGAKTTADREIKSPDSEKNAVTAAPSGTTDFIAKFDASGNPTANSMMFDTGANIGVGTTGPEQILHADGPSEILSTGPGAGFKFRNRGSTTSADDWVWYSSGNVARFWRSGVGDILGITKDGNLGIGTIAPQGKLEVVTSNDTVPTSIPAWDSRHFVVGGAANTGGIAMSYDQTNGAGYIQSVSPNVAWRNLVFQSGGGNVGIGTTAPAAKLHVSGPGIIRARVNADSNAGLALTLNNQPKWSVATVNPGQFQIYNDAIGQNAVWIDSASNNVGIGTTNSAAKLHIAGSADVAGTLWLQPNASKGANQSHVHWGPTGDWYIRSAASGGNVIMQDSGGNVGIGTSAPAAKLHVSGSGIISGPLTLGYPRTIIQGFDGDGFHWFGPSPDGDLAFGIHRLGPANYNFIVQRLVIEGGSDLAEPFEVSEAETIQPGMVVAIDPEQPGRLRLADKGYDRTVAGIVSGANGIKPGLTMRQEGTLANGSLPVALTGRVYCWADASNGPIEPGDLLTTSNTPGHAMKVTNYAKAQGAIIGKAMTGLKEGKGFVLVLVTLQ